MGSASATSTSNINDDDADSSQDFFTPTTDTVQNNQGSYPNDESLQSLESRHHLDELDAVRHELEVAQRERDQALAEQRETCSKLEAAKSELQLDKCRLEGKEEVMSNLVSACELVVLCMRYSIKCFLLLFV